MTLSSPPLTLIALAALMTGAKGPPVEYVVTGDGVVAASVEGKAGRVRIDPGAPSLPIINRPLALAAGLKPGMFGFGVRYRIGPKRVEGATDVTHLVVDGMSVRRRVAWFDEPYAAGVDGVVGPGTLPAPVVRFVLHAPRAGERVVALPLVDAGALIGNWGGLFAEIQIGGAPLKVRFDLHHPHSLASAGAGQRIADAQGGTLAGPVDRTEIVFGIERPIRRMTLARPLAIGPLSLEAIHVRVSDYGTAASIPDADAVADPEEIVVTAKKKASTQDRVSIGRDQLDRCSSLVFDKPAKVIRLSCL